MVSVLNYTYTISGNYIIAIITLSVVVNIILLPLYHFAEKLQNKERSVQSKLRPIIEEINAVFQGAERFMMMRTLYRQAKYHPVYAIRTSLGFLIQVPFFLAAYLLLLHYEPFNGVSVLWFSDLSQADKLVFNVNVMPIIMTVVNLASGFIYTKNLTKNEKIQIWVISILFLVLLYKSPVALVLYWTLNNVFSLFKNIAYHRFSKSLDVSLQPENSLSSKTKELWKKLQQNGSRFSIRQNIKDIATSGTLKIFLFLFIVERFSYYNLLSKPIASHTGFINFGLIISILLLIALSRKKLSSCSHFFLHYLGQQTITLKNSVGKKWIYPLWWSALFLMCLFKAKEYSDLGKKLGNNHVDVSATIATLCVILAFLCGLGLKSFFCRFDKKRRQHVIRAIIISILILLGVTFFISWITNSYAIKEPAHIKEYLAGVLCLLLIVTHYYRIQNVFYKLALFRDHLVINYLTIHPIFRIVLVIVLFINLAAFLRVESSPSTRQFYLLESLLIVFFFFIVFLNAVKKYKLKPTIWLFLSSLSLLYFMILLSGPMMLYASSHENILVSKLHLLLPHVSYFSLLFLFSVIVYLLASESFKKLIIFSVIFSIIVGYLYTFVLIKDFGQLDAFTFRNPGLLEMPLWQTIIEILAGILLAFCVWRFIPKFQKTLIPLLIIMLVSVSAYSSFQLISNKAIKAIAHTGNSEDRHKINTYSKHQNIVILMLD
ncbi:YidC/Oxa1 family membrane protein insertase, partial [bacterium]|nr:YidC/Oxa1 family membrane protein insertase [bacterium]